MVVTAGADIEALRAVLPPDLLGPHADTASDLLDPLVHALEAGDVVLFKGSNASRVGALVDALLAKSSERG